MHVVIFLPTRNKYNYRLIYLKRGVKNPIKIGKSLNAVTAEITIFD